MTLKEMIGVMQAYEAGKDIQAEGANGWNDIVGHPSWDWENYVYRIKPNKFKEIVSTIRDTEIETTNITFGGISHNDTGEVKIVYDSHIRRVMFNLFKVGDKAKFKLVPLNDYGETLIKEINKSEYTK